MIIISITHHFKSTVLFWGSSNNFEDHFANVPNVRLILEKVNVYTRGGRGTLRFPVV